MAEPEIVVIGTPNPEAVRYLLQCILEWMLEEEVDVDIIQETEEEIQEWKQTG